MSKHILSLVGSALLLLGAANANAACNYAGKIERIYQSSTTTYVYLKSLSSLTSSTYYYCNTSDPDLANAMHSAKANGEQYVYVSGNRSSCPTSGTGRYMGSCVYINNY